MDKQSEIGRIAFEIKAVTEAGEFEGYGAIFGNVDRGKDIVQFGAFRASLAKHQAEGTFPAMLYGHDREKEIGEWLEIREDATGLLVRGRLWIEQPNPDTDALKAYRGMKKTRSRMGMSIGFRTTISEYDEATGVRTIKEAELWEVSVVTFPMNERARVTAVKSAHKTIREFEDFLRDVGGYSHAAAKAIAASGFKAAEDRDDPAGNRPEPRDEDGVGALSSILAALKAS